MPKKRIYENERLADQADHHSQHISFWNILGNQATYNHDNTTEHVYGVICKALPLISFTKITVHATDDVDTQ
jgi:hypothetical protein